MLIGTLKHTHSASYDDWIHVVWALKISASEVGIDKEVRQLAHEFSNGCPAKYKPAEVDVLYKEAHQEKGYNFDSLKRWASEFDSQTELESQIELESKVAKIDCVEQQGKNIICIQDLLRKSDKYLATMFENLTRDTIVAGENKRGYQWNGDI